MVLVVIWSRCWGVGCNGGTPGIQEGYVLRYGYVYVYIEGGVGLGWGEIENFEMRRWKFLIWSGGYMVEWWLYGGVVVVWWLLIYLMCLYDVWCMMYDVWCMMWWYYDIWCMMYDVQCSMFNVQCSMFNVQCYTHVKLLDSIDLRSVALTSHNDHIGQ